MDDDNTLFNALIGAIVTAVTSSFIPFAPVAGGALAGYLEGGSRSDGVRVGLISGLIGVIPLVAILGMILFGLSVVSLGAVESALPFAVGGAFVTVAFLFVAVYTVGLSALGGWVGNYLKYETEVGETPQREAPPRV